VSGFDVSLGFDVGDPETVAWFHLEVDVLDPATAVAMVLDRLDGAEYGRAGFGRDDIVQVVVTRRPPGVADNLLYRNVR
jgi:hypothetical protein